MIPVTRQIYVGFGDFLTVDRKFSYYLRRILLVMDYTWGDQQLLASQETIQKLPHELLELIQGESNSQYLDALAAAALSPGLTDKLFSFYEPVFTDFCARWITSSQLSIKRLASFSAFARVLPFAPHLLAYAEELVLRPQDSPLNLLSSQSDGNPESLPDPELQELLLATFRLLVYENGTFAKHISMSKLQPLLRHESRPIRYLSIRVICLYMHAADAAVEDMMHRYLRADAVEGDWEGRKIDYVFLRFVSKSLRVENHANLVLVYGKRSG